MELLNKIGGGGEGGSTIITIRVVARVYRASKSIVRAFLLDIITVKRFTEKH